MLSQTHNIQAVGWATLKKCTMKVHESIYHDNQYYHDETLVIVLCYNDLYSCIMYISFTQTAI